MRATFIVYGFDAEDVDDKVAAALERLGGGPWMHVDVHLRPHLERVAGDVVTWAATVEATTT